MGEVRHSEAWADTDLSRTERKKKQKYGKKGGFKIQHNKNREVGSLFLSLSLSLAIWGVLIIFSWLFGLQKINVYLKMLLKSIIKHKIK